MVVSGVNANMEGAWHSMRAKSNKHACLFLNENKNRRS